MSQITPTLIWYYYICPREVWLMAHELNPEQDNQLMEIGRLIHETTYKRARKEISLGGMKLDLIKRENGELVVGEIKKSSRFEQSAKMQLAYYLYNLKSIGIDARGELLIPKEKKKIAINSASLLSCTAATKAFTASCGDIKAFCSTAASAVENPTVYSATITMRTASV